MKLADLIHALGKSRQDPFFLSHQDYFKGFTSNVQGDNLLLASIHEALTFTFDENDILIKIELCRDEKCCEWFNHQFSFGVEIPITKNAVLTHLGEPKQKIKNPAKQNKEEQWLYEKEGYWLSLKFINAHVESMQLLLSRIIPTSLKQGFVPIRTCKSKK